MKYIKLMGLFLFVISWNGYAVDGGLYPDFSGEKVVIKVKVPNELVARKVQATYRSTVCTFVAYDVNGESYRRDSYRQLEAQATPERGTEILRAELAVDGGGSCRWKLSNVIFGVEYENTSQFGEDVTYGVGGGVVVMFDEADSAYGGPNFEEDGNFVLRPDYYPWVRESFVGGCRRVVHLTRSGEGDLMYRAVNGRSIEFEPILHSRYAVYSVGPKVKRIGDSGVFYYPDGSSSSERHGRPDFEKLQRIRMSVDSGGSAKF
ncbi:hypothetical protein [Stenotrophomonas sp. TEPEL]|uniref:hypothetical protein n=1 Tax=Stenotrophomonas sp. TEPEL TaxID=2283801 RepID=UPI001046931D|nr:hypothetical protein [Stenotrophomonas sp. TEPEL]